MFRDPKIQLAIVSFVIFLVLWAVLSIGLKVDAGNPFAAFIATATVAAWNMLLLFVKPNGGIPDATPEAPAALEVVDAPAVAK